MRRQNIIHERAIIIDRNIVDERATDWNGNTFAGASHVQELNHTM